LVDVEVAEAVPQGWDIWMKWEETRDAAGGVPPGLGTDAAVLRADGGRHLGFVRMVARKPT
jgi:hypothetical protein